MSDNQLCKNVLANGQHVIFTDKHSSLLECLESQNIEVHFHCRDGFCGACRVKLNKGQVNYPQGEPLAFVGDGEVLSCCCIPTTDIDISVE
ncbi:class I ribonucleotide reductase maintenance protein YfaE [Thalassotalea euphylliae]|uniref:class I ribonucleotide reductase maintenance protein YfaE n=1 Tax=Thalassotalea euphylliae TaxID=1655234 RepID=UPI00362A12B6